MAESNRQEKRVKTLGREPSKHFPDDNRENVNFWGKICVGTKCTITRNYMAFRPTRIMKNMRKEKKIKLQ